MRILKSLLVMLASTILVTSLAACQIEPQVHRFEIPVPSQLNHPVQLPSGAEQLPIKIGIYYSPEFRNYEHFDRTIGESGFATPIGKFSIRQFDSMFSAMFSQPVRVYSRPPWTVTESESNPTAVIEPQIERFEMNAEVFSTNPLTAQIDYRFKLYSTDGTTKAKWKISASDIGKSSWGESGEKAVGGRTEAVIRKSSTQFMQEFNASNDVKTWLVTPRKRESAVVLTSTTLEGVGLSANLYWQVGLVQTPIGDLSVQSPVLTTRLTIKNNRPEPIVFDPSNLRLHYNRGTTLTPTSVHYISQKILQGGGSDGHAGAYFFFNPAIVSMLGAMADMDQASWKDQKVMEVTDKLSREQLDNQTITPNQTVSGTVYFMVSEVDGRLDEPKLKVGIIDPSQKMGYETTLNMTTGAATGGTLHLAGLKPLETFTDKPVLDAATVDITAGTYVSVIQGAPPYVFPNRSPMITFKQSGENIIGTNVSRKSLKIIGTRKGDTIKFKFGNDVTGVWKINPDGTRLKGNFEYDGFYPSRGIWNLTKVE